MPAIFIVVSQTPSCFLSWACSGPGLGHSWPRAVGAAQAAARATAKVQRTFVRIIGTLQGKTGDRPRGHGALGRRPYGFGNVRAVRTTNAPRGFRHRTDALYPGRRAAGRSV